MNEWSGIGNHNTAQFWEYDTRTGRRLNLDPVPQISISDYAVNQNNPILINDPDGDCPECKSKKGGWRYIVKRGDNLINIAKAHSISLESLRQANNIPKDEDKIYPGDELKIVYPPAPKWMANQAAEEINLLDVPSKFAEGILKEGFESVGFGEELSDLLSQGISTFINPKRIINKTDDIFGNGIRKILRKEAKTAAKNGARGLWKLTKEGASAIKKHKAFGTIYKSKSDGLWWSVDKAGHGGSKFKVFKETDKGLEWYKDADEFGDFIPNKHKGGTGKFIPWGELGTVK